MERVGATFLIAGVLTFLLGFFLQGVMPVLTLRNVPVATVEQVATPVIPEFFELAEEYPIEFERSFGKPSPESFAEALTLGRDVYVAEACWHCHSQFVRPVSNEDVRFGPVSNADEYQNEMNLPHLFGTRLQFRGHVRVLDQCVEVLLDLRRGHRFGGKVGIDHRQLQRIGCIGTMPSMRQLRGLERQHAIGFGRGQSDAGEDPQQRQHREHAVGGVADAAHPHP